MTSKQEQQKVTTNPNPTYKSLSDLDQANADLEEARSQINTLVEQRDTTSATIGRLDRDVARLQDALQAEEEKNRRLIKQFEILYNMHESLLEQCLNTTTANTITTGKLSESIVKFKFIIPQANTEE
jgi:septal ring factor EnvC (AmiA/AmiB activator)